MELKSIEWVMGLLVTAITIILTAFYRKLAATNDRVDRVKENYVRRDDFSGAGWSTLSELTTRIKSLFFRYQLFSKPTLRDKSVIVNKNVES